MMINSLPAKAVREVAWESRFDLMERRIEPLGTDVVHPGNGMKWLDVVHPLKLR